MNTEKDSQSCAGKTPESTTKEVSVRYFAVFRDQRGLSSEKVRTSAATVGELYDELCRVHKFSLPVERVRVAVNDEFRDWAEPVYSGSTVVFIPPVAGG